MPKTIEFIFDFASPNAYFAHRVLVPAAEARSIPVEIVPCLLGGIFKLTGNQAPMVAFASIKGKFDYEMLEVNRFIKRHKLERFHMNPNFPVNSLLLMRGLVAAQAEGLGTEYMETMLKGMWEEGKKLDDPEIAKAVLEAAGLPAEHLLRRTQDPEVKQALAANTDRAVERGAFGIPTFFVGEEMWFGKERIDAVLEAAAAA